MITKQYEGGFNAVMSKYRARSIVDYFRDKKVGSIADIGCGPGDIIETIDSMSDMINKCRNVACIDADKHYISSLKKRFGRDPRFSLIESDVEKQPLPEGKYDVILLVDILEHLNRPVPFLKKVRRSLAPGGHIVMIVPNARSIHRLAGKEMGLIKNIHELGPADLQVGHRRYFDSGKLEKLVAASGLKTVFRSGILLKFRPNSEMEKLSEDYCNVLYNIGLKLPEHCAELFFVGRVK